MAEISKTLGDGYFRVRPHCDGCAHDYAVLALEVCSYSIACHYIILQFKRDIIQTSNKKNVELVYLIAIDPRMCW